MAHLNYAVGGDSNLVSFKSAARVPIDSLKVHFKPIQEGTGDPSPENVRPITGWTGVEARQSGKNLFDQSRQPIVYGAYYAWYDIAPEGYVTLSVKDKGNGADISGISFGVKSKRGTGVLWVLLNGQYIEPRVVIDAECLLLNPATSEALNKLLARYDIQLELGSTATSYEPYTGQTIPVEFHGKNLCPAATGTEIKDTWTRPSGSSSYKYTINGLDPEQDYTLQVTITSSFENDSARRLYLVGTTQDFISTSSTSVPITRYITKKPKSDGTIEVVHNVYELDNNAEYAAALTNIQLELGSTATAYEPYNNTFYGGYVDIAKGELVETYKKFVLTGDEDIRRGVWTSNAYSVQKYNKDFAFLASTTDNLRCNMLKPKEAGYYGITDGYCSAMGGETATYCAFIFNSDSMFGTDVETCKAKLKEMYENGNPFYFTLPMQPRYYNTYQLTPMQLSTLLSTNNIWSNANDVTEVSYAVHDSAMIRAAKRRMAMAANSRDFLPGAYQKVEYLESSGEQYIATNYVPTVDETSVDFTMQIVTVSSGDNIIYGANDQGKAYYFELYNASRWYGAIGLSRYNNIQWSGYGNAYWPQRIVANLDEIKNTNLETGNTQTASRNLTYDTFQNNLPMFIFAWNNNGSAQYLHKGLRLFSLTLYRSGIMSANFVPCVRKSDSKPGMYDTVSKTFYTNAGTGEFIVPTQTV